ncbi:hypothetical protein M404DRAFT_992185 [Pisolithus tinctorius Marx 270]|uniref:Uncharacterized protein n=1 Tax=Pisolithus tinctorius Marx 270 TaxID=870435 RepID=A0A0C3PXY0_PISTI|nr:hypothetical protein M404DRAFT_992185 [Pisolithus tinctorius Marx 270]
MNEISSHPTGISENHVNPRLTYSRVPHVPRFFGRGYTITFSSSRWSIVWQNCHTISPHSGAALKRRERRIVGLRNGSSIVI